MRTLDLAGADYGPSPSSADSADGVDQSNQNRLITEGDSYKILLLAELRSVLKQVFLIEEAACQLVWARRKSAKTSRVVMWKLFGGLPLWQDVLDVSICVVEPSCFFSPRKAGRRYKIKHEYPANELFSMVIVNCQLDAKSLPFVLQWYQKSYEWKSTTCLLF